MENFFIINECECIEDPEIAQKCREFEEQKGLKRSSWEVTTPKETQKIVSSGSAITPDQDNKLKNVSFDSKNCKFQ